MSIENLTIAEAKQKLEEYKELQSLFNLSSHEDEGGDDSSCPYIIGKSYLYRSVTMTILGRLKEIYKDELVFEDASWIADTGRFHKVLAEGVEAGGVKDRIEIEPFTKDVIIGRGALIDCTEWLFDLPRQAK